MLNMLVFPACAHEFWLQPSNYHAAPGDTVTISLFVGQKFSGDTLPFIPDWIARFELHGRPGTVDIESEVGEDPAASLRLSQPDTYLVVYQSRYESSDIEAERFNGYLRESGHDDILAARRRAGREHSSVHESYVRCAKTLVHVGSGDAGAHVTRPVSLPLELIPERDPYALAPEEPVAFTLLYEGRPLAGKLVSAFSSRDRDTVLRARTDAHGKVHFTLPLAGAWLINAVHILPGNDAVDWFSFWASLTFAR